MTLPRIVVPLLGLSALIGGLAFTNVRSHSSPDLAKASLKLDSKTEAALETLHEEMQRRFHDRNDVDFGFSRMVRPNARAHDMAPLMPRDRFAPMFDKEGLGKTYRMVPAKEGADAFYEINDPEVGWTDSRKLRPMMRAENEREKQAIDTLLGSKVDLAVYTFGLIGQDAIPPRAKGPGYLRQKTTDGPAATSLVPLIEKAWRTGNANSIVEGPKGWYLMVHRVKADTQACVTCHAHTRQALVNDRSIPPSERPLYKVGDDLGVVVIAVRPR